MNINLDSLEYTQASPDSSTLENFTSSDFTLNVFVITDDILEQMAPYFKRPGPVPICSDSELITMALVGECRGWARETELIDNWQFHRDLFPNIPSRTRFNRRRRHLMYVINIIRRVVLQTLDVAQARMHVIDSLPIPAIHFHLVPSSKNDWEAHGARFGRVSTKKMTIFGYKLHMLVTVDGVIVDFELAGANATDLNVGHELLENHTDIVVIGDKGYIGKEVSNTLEAQNRIRLITLPRRNQKNQFNRETRRFINSIRQIIETVNGQLTDQFNIEKNYAHTFWGLAARLYTKLAAHTICIYINRMLGHTDFLQIKRLAFPTLA